MIPAPALYLVVLCVFVFLSGEAGNAAPATSSRQTRVIAAPLKSETFDLLKSRYLSLRNTDPKVESAATWTGLAGAMERFVNTRPKDAHAPFALFDAAILYEELYRAHGGDDRFRRALGLFERLAREYPGHSLADDGLVRRGDLFLLEGSDSEAAKRCYREVVEGYPDSDFVEVAKARLAGSAAVRRAVKNTPETPLTQKSSENHPVIVIDPGHGGDDFGALGQGGLLEKDVVLDVAVQLRTILQDRIGAVVRLTRTADTFIPLPDRTNLANDFEADLFVSLHTNASPKSKLSGLEVYYLDNTDNQGSQKLAERENATMPQDTAGDLSFILSDLIQNAKLSDSIRLAHVLDRAIIDRLRAHRFPVTSFGVKKAPFYVLVGAHMPCVLVELFFIDHASDGRNLADKNFRTELAEGLAHGIIGYLRQSVP
jgi:N-acetylmuramoyl-L-alanine amidase